ncbi:uncharacterized protein MELLADRAFT_112146 [Melampsora larici-populina 98AG31]|uniref:Uncharacterized protein n=1 Tax=Melampsora larici-populina (strain 98AG31 / pathotype 3-4-7) TaxID=747676 RepID=F4S5J1_MELLP|nr:uncharacterized protein MELLADRAFT_112146 [Melampsora larici-populina 98AG31]EGG00033.1 hypothetical protein MELLADRAFT_112146 [Melampsora larici-populina 98AG31]
MIFRRFSGCPFQMLNTPFKGCWVGRSSMEVSYSVSWSIHKARLSCFAILFLSSYSNPNPNHQLLSVKAPSNKFPLHIYIFINYLLMDPPNPVFAPSRVTQGQKRARADSAGTKGSPGATKPSQNRAKVNPGFSLLSHTIRDNTKISDDPKRGKRKDQTQQNNSCKTQANQKKNKNSSSSSKNTQLSVLPPPNKYSALNLVTLRSIMKPSGVKGIGLMRKDELLQLCLLYNPEIPSTQPPPSRPAATTSNEQSRQQLTRAFQESLDQEDI